MLPCKTCILSSFCQCVSPISDILRTTQEKLTEQVDQTTIHLVIRLLKDSIDAKDDNISEETYLRFRLVLTEILIKAIEKNPHTVNNDEAFLLLFANLRDDSPLMHEVASTGLAILVENKPKFVDVVRLASRLGAGTPLALAKIAEKNPSILLERMPQCGRSAIEQLTERVESHPEEVLPTLVKMAEKSPQLINCKFFLQLLSDGSNNNHHGVATLLVDLLKVEPLFVEQLFIRTRPAFKETLLTLLQQAEFYRAERITRLFISGYRSTLLTQRAIDLLSQAGATSHNLMNAFQYMKEQGFPLTELKKLLTHVQLCIALPDDAWETLYNEQSEHTQQFLLTERLKSYTFDPDTPTEIGKFLLHSHNLAELDFATETLTIGKSRYPTSSENMKKIQEACVGVGLPIWPTPPEAPKKEANKEALPKPTNQPQQDDKIMGYLGNIYQKVTKIDQTQQQILQNSTAQTEFMQQLQKTLEGYQQQLEQLSTTHENPYNDDYQKALYDTLVRQLCSLYVASSAIRHDVLKTTRKGAISSLGQLLSSISSCIPIFGLTAELLGSFLIAVDQNLQERMIERFFQLAPSQGAMELLVYATSKKIIDMDLDQDALDAPGALVSRLAQAISNIIDPVSFLASQAVEKLLQEPPLTEASERGRKHGERLATLIIAKVYTGEMNAKPVNPLHLSQLAEEAFGSHTKGVAANHSAHDQAEAIIAAIRVKLKVVRCKFYDREHLLTTCLEEVLEEQAWQGLDTTTTIIEALIANNIVQRWQSKDIRKLFRANTQAYTIDITFCEEEKLSQWIRDQLTSLLANSKNTSEPERTTDANMRLTGT